jgi:hypothetical protein
MQHLEMFMRTGRLPNYLMDELLAA